MTELKAILRTRTGTYDEYYNANLVYALGEHTYITGGSHAGKWKVGDGVTAWRNLPYAPPDRAVGGNDNATGTVTDTGAALSVPIPLTTAAPAASATQTAAGTGTLRAKIKVLVDNIAWIFTNKANLASPTFTGTPRVPNKTTAATNDGTLIASEAQVYLKANLASPTFTGTPRVPNKTGQAGADGTLIATEAQVTDSIKAAITGTQKWTAAVAARALLPSPSSLDPTYNWLCRVIDDPAPANNGVWQLIAGASAWTYFSDNLDFIDETELAAAIDAEAARADGAIAGAVLEEAEAREEADEALEGGKVDKLTGETDCDLIYAKRADGSQGYQELWTEPEPNSIPARDDYGVLFAAGAPESPGAVTVNAQLDGEAAAREAADEAEEEARNDAIAAAVKTTLQDQDGSVYLPPVTESSFADLLQATRNNLKWLNETGGGEDAGMGEALPPLLTDRDGRLICGRGGTLVELNITEQPA